MYLFIYFSLQSPLTTRKSGGFDSDQGNQKKKKEKLPQPPEISDMELISDEFDRRVWRECTNSESEFSVLEEWLGKSAIKKKKKTVGKKC